MNRPARLLLSLLVGVPLAAALPGGSIVAAILGISFLIFVHEWGHFYACKLTGTRTETFSIGFGPRLFGWEKTKEGARRFTVGRRQLDPAEHAMDFRIAAVPLGGFVKMAGEMPGEGGDENGEPAPDEFGAKSAWARIFIVSAGVIMNFFTAIVFYALCIHFNHVHVPPVVGTVEPGSAAWVSGLQTGDRILSIDGNKTPTFLDVKVEVAVASGDKPTSVVIKRAGKEQTLAFTPNYDEDKGFQKFGIGQASRLTIGAGDAAFEIAANETVTVAGLPTLGGAETARAIRSAYRAGMLPIEIKRADGTAFTLQADPKADRGELPGPKVAITNYLVATVEFVRGPAEGVLQPGDIVTRAITKSGSYLVDSGQAWSGLPYQAPIETLFVRRGTETLELPVTLGDSGVAARWLRGVALKIPKQDNRMAPLPAGQMYEFEGGLWRLPVSPARDAGMPLGARVLNVGGMATNDLDAVIEALKNAKPGVAIPFKVLDEAGTESVIQVTPVALEWVGGLDLTVAAHKERWEPDGLGDSIALGWGRMTRETTNVFRTIGAFFAGTLSFRKNVAGPARLIKVSGDMAESGILSLLWFLAYVSVMLAVLNILPIPILDGGHLMFIIIEKIRGKPLSDAMVINLMKVGLFLLLVLMGFAFFNDFVHFFLGDD